MRLAPMIVIMIQLYHLICLDVLFLFKWCTYGDSTRNCFYFRSLFYFFFSIRLRVGHAKNNINPLFFKFIFSLDSIILLLFAIVLFILIVSNYILFFISSLVWFFLIYFQFLIFILLIAVCSILNHFLGWFVFIPIPPLDIYFHLIFMSNLALILLIVVFLIIF